MESTLGVSDFDSYVHNNGDGLALMTGRGAIYQARSVAERVNGLAPVHDFENMP